MTFKNNVLVTSGSGSIGSQVIPQLLSSQFKVILTTSNAARLQASLPSEATNENVVVEQGNIKEHAWTESILRKHAVDAVVLCLSAYDEFVITLNILDAMEQAGTIKHLIYISAAGDFVSPEGFQQVLKTHSAEIVLVKPIIEHKLKYANYPWTTTVVGPTFFFDNDLRSKEAMLQGGLYPEPLGDVGVSRVDSLDTAVVIRNVLLNPGKWNGKKIMVGSKLRFTGSETTKLWGNALGKPIEMSKPDKEGLDQLEARFKQYASAEDTGKAWARDLRRMFADFASQGWGLSDKEYEELVECLGREASSYPDFVTRTAKSWVS